MIFTQKPQRNFHCENNPTPANENIKTKLNSNGSALNCQSFWDCFDSSIHKNTDLNDIDKFSY